MFKLIKTYRAGNTLGAVYILNGRECSTLIGGNAATVATRLRVALGVQSMGASLFASMRMSAAAERRTSDAGRARAPLNHIEASSGISPDWTF